MVPCQRLCSAAKRSKRITLDPMYLGWHFGFGIGFYEPSVSQCIFKEYAAQQNGQSASCWTTGVWGWHPGFGVGFNESTVPVPVYSAKEYTAQQTWSKRIMPDYRVIGVGHLFSTSLGVMQCVLRAFSYTIPCQK